MASTPTLTPAGNRRRARVWWITGGVLLCLLVGAAFLAPLVIANRIEARLASRFGTDVEIGDVDIELTAPGVIVEGVAFTARGVIDVELPEVAVRWSWLTILSGAPPAVAVREPHLRVRIDPRKPPEPQDRQPVSLAGFRSVHVERGSVTVELQTLHEPVNIEVSDIEVTLRNTALPSTELTAKLEASARIGPTGRLHMSGAFVPFSPRLGWGLEFALENVDLVPLNPLLNSVVEMDASEGTISLHGYLNRSEHRLQGRIEPRFTDLRLLDPDESARHPMGEAIFSEMLSGAENAMLIDIPTDGDAGASLAQLMATNWESVIEGVIQRGYRRQLNRLTGYEATIGGVKIDFTAGHLRLLDVSIVRDTGLVETPFLHVAELDVQFDESITDTDVDSYKHVVIRRPVLTFVAHEDESRRQMQFDPEWPSKVSSLPFQTADLRVVDGTIRFIEHRKGSIHEVAIENVQLTGDQMARDLSPPGERRAIIVASGMALGTTRARVSVEYEPASEKGNTHFEFVLDPIPLESLNPLARTHAGIDASAGTVGFSAMFDSCDGLLKAQVALQVDDVDLIGETETSIEHPLREFILTSRLRRLHGQRLRIELERDYDTGLFQQVGMALLREALNHK